MTNLAGIFTPCDPFRMKPEERQRLRWTLKAGPALDGTGGIPPSRAGKRANNLLRQIDQIETVLHDVSKGQRPPRETMMELLRSWLEFGDDCEVYQSRIEGLEFHQKTNLEFTPNTVHSYF